MTKSHPWQPVTKPKNKGGLVVIRLRLQNDALLMKNIHNFFSKADLPWVKLIGKRIIGMTNFQVQL
jgi:hypothetical protein